MGRRGKDFPELEPEEPERAGGEEDFERWKEEIRKVAPLRPAPRHRHERESHAKEISSGFPSLSGATPRLEAPSPLSSYRAGGTANAPAENSGLTHAQARRFRQGKLPVEARLDLHGMTEEQAFHGLYSFLARARDCGRRCVLIITGKGGREGGSGLLRRCVPVWLAFPEFREYVIAHAPAMPRDGGDGALYVLIRRKPRRGA